MRFYGKQPLIVLLIVGVLCIPALLLYWLGSAFVAKLSLVFIIAGLAVIVSQLLAYSKFDFEQKKFVVTHGWLYPKEFKSIPFDDIKQLSIGRHNKENKIYFLFLDLKDNTSIGLFGNRSLARLMKRAGKIAKLMNKPVVSETRCANPSRTMSKFPDACSIQVYLLMGYAFAVFPLFLIVAVGATLVLGKLHALKNEELVIERLYEYYQPVIDEAEKIQAQCTKLDKGYVSGKMAIRLPKQHYKEDWFQMVPPQYMPADLGSVNTVVLVDSFEHDWGRSSGEIVLLKERKKFYFNIASEYKEKRLGSTIHAGTYLNKYLRGLPAQ